MQHAPPVAARLTRPGLAILCATILVSVAGTSMTTVALPDMQRDFRVSDDNLTWVVTAYLITFATGTVGYGRLADMRGTKPLYLFGLGLFGVASVLVALAPEFWGVVAARALQGLGGTAVPSLSMATIVRTTDPVNRGGPMGAMVLSVGVGFGIGPLLGGSLTQWLGWESVFLATGAASVGLFLAAVRYVPPVAGHVGQSFDFLGALLLSGAVSGLLVSLNRLPRDVSDPAGLAGLGATLVLGALLAWRTAVVSHPYISTQVVRNVRFMALAAIGFGAQGAHFAAVVLIPLVLSRYHGQSVIEIGLWMVPGACALAVSGMAGGMLSRTVGSRALILAGTTVLLAGAATFHAVGVGWEPAGLSLMYVVVGMGYGLINSPVLNSSTAELPQDLAGVGVGIYNLLFFLGGAVCVAIAGAILRARAGMTEGVDPLFSGEAAAFSDAALVMLAASAMAFFVALLLPSRRPAPATAPAGGVRADSALKPRAKPNAGR